MYELFIENFKVDIDQKLSVQLTFAIDDIANYGSRETSFSKTIVLPGTGRNNQIFGFIYDIASYNYEAPGSANIGSVFNAAQTSRAELRLNGLLVLNGVFRITNIIKDKDIIEYEGALFGELSGFIANIGRRKLEDLDFSAYNHNYTRDTIVTSWDRRFTKDITVNFTTVPNNQIIIQSYTLDLKLKPNDQIKITNANISGNNKTYTVIDYTPPIENFLFGFIRVQESVQSNNNDAVTIEYPIEDGKGYYYPLIDHGTYSTPEKNNSRTKIDYDYRTFRPALYVKEYIDKIFSEPNSGYRYQSDFINSDFFKKLIVPCNVNRITKLITDLLLANQSRKNLLWQFSDVISPFWLGFNNIVYNFLVIENTNGDPNYPIYRYIAPEATVVKVEYKIKALMRYASWPSNHRFRYGVRKNGQNVLYKEIFRARENAGNVVVLRSYNVDDTINLEISLQQNDYLDFPIEIQNVEPGSYIDFASIYVTSINPITNDIQLNDTINLNSLIPKNITQKDFFTWILKMFNLYVVEDKLDNKLLHIIPYKDFLDSDIIDWTNKIARDKPWQIKPMGLLNSRFFEYKYKEDNDFYNESYKKKYNLPYGSNLQDTQFEFAKDKQTIEIGFSPTVLIQYDGTDQKTKVLPAIYKKSSGNAVDQEERMDSNIRILMAKKITANVASWSITNNDATGAGRNLGAALTAYGYAGHFDDPLNPTVDINFGANAEIYFDPATYPTANLFNTYWSGYIAEIVDKDSKLLSCHARLTPLDIAQLDFSKPIMIDGVLFRLNKIEDYDYRNDELVKVELLKIINYYFPCAHDWTKQNYTGTRFRNGDEIPQVTGTTAWANLTTPAWCHYNNDPANDAIYGKLYNWYAINDPRGFAPNGYRVATDEDWTTLVNCLGGENVAGGKLKSTIGWNAPNAGATNESKFSALPGGLRLTDGSFSDLLDSGFWWSSTEQNNPDAFYRTMYASLAAIGRSGGSKKFGFSVRLIKE